jgi:DNA polymerase-3 subunit beta
VKGSCLQEHLSRGLSIVGRAVATRSTLPALSNILLSADQSGLRLAATNLEIAITCAVSALVEEEGSIAVPARLFSEFVNSFPADRRVDLALNARTRTLNIKCAAFEANIKGLDPEEFPPIPEVADPPVATIDPKVLRQAIEMVAFAAAPDDSRPVLQGVLTSLREDKVTLAAADGFRLAVKTAPLATPAAQPLDIIVPAKSYLELARILSDETQPVEIRVTPNRTQVLFQLSNTALVSRLIEGTFPNYQQIIPTRFATRVVVNTQDFLKATKIASFFARESANIVRLQIQAGENTTPGRLTIAAQAADLGDTVGAVEAIAVEGENAQIAFSAKFLNDVLDVLESAQVCMEITSPASPGVIRPVDSDGYTCVIMPMHLARGA